MLGSEYSMLGSEYSLASAPSAANLLAEESSVMSTTGRAGGPPGHVRHRLSSSSAGGYWQQQQQQQGSVGPPGASGSFSAGLPAWQPQLLQQGSVGPSGGSFSAGLGNTGLPVWQASSLQLEPTQTIDEEETEGEQLGQGGESDEDMVQGLGGVLAETGSSGRLQGIGSTGEVAGGGLGVEGPAGPGCQLVLKAGEGTDSSSDGGGSLRGTLSAQEDTWAAAETLAVAARAPSGASAERNAVSADPFTPRLDSTVPAVPAQASGSEGEGHLSNGGNRSSPDNGAGEGEGQLSYGDSPCNPGHNAIEGEGRHLSDSGTPNSPGHTTSCVVTLRHAGSPWGGRASTMGGVPAAASEGGCWKLPAAAAECSKHGLEAVASDGGGWKLAAAAGCSGSELQAAITEGCARELAASATGYRDTGELEGQAGTTRGSADSWQLSTASDEGEGEVSVGYHGQEGHDGGEGGSRVTTGSRLGLGLLQLPIDGVTGGLQAAAAAAAPPGQRGAVQTVLAPRLGAGMLLSIPSPTGELRCIDRVSGDGGSSYKPRQLLSCPAGPAGLYRTGGADATGSGSLLHTAAPGASRFAGSIHAWDGSLSSNAPRARSTTPAAGVEGSHAAGACADGLTGILALVRQLQGNLAGLELDMQQLHGALHRRSSTADASMMVRRHQPQHHQDTP
jgi:hypothetical protein